MNPSSLRGSGRTTRMLAKAKELAAKGRAVYIIAADEVHAQCLAALIPEADTLGIKFESSFFAFDWITMRTRGAHPNCVFLVDHYAIESRFENVLAELHRYDEVPHGR
jgi:hypothetical protein